MDGWMDVLQAIVFAARVVRDWSCALELSDGECGENFQMSRRFRSLEMRVAKTAVKPSVFHMCCFHVHKRLLKPD